MGKKIAFNMDLLLVKLLTNKHAPVITQLINAQIYANSVHAHNFPK